MAYPTGSGSEILARTTLYNQSSTESSFRWDGTMATVGTATYVVPALHIITVLSVVFTEQAESTTQKIKFRIYNGSQTLWLLHDQILGSKETFVWSDKLVLIGGDKLLVDMSDANNCDVVCTYIDQNWT